MKSCSTYSNIYLLIRILNVYSQMMTALQAKQLSRSLSRYIFLSSSDFFILRLLKSRKIAKFYIIRLLLQFSLGSRDFDVITSHICLLTKEIETGINIEKLTIFIFFLTFKKMFAIFYIWKKEVSSYLLIVT